MGAKDYGGIDLMSYIEVACHVFVCTHAMQKNNMIQDHDMILYL